MLLLLFSLSFLSYPMDCSMPGLPVHHQIPDFAQTNFHWVTDAIQLSQTLSSTSLPAFNLSQNWGHFQRVGSSHQVTKASSSVLSMNIQGWFLWELTDLISLQSKVKVKSFSRVQLFAAPQTLACQAPLSMGFFQARILERVAISFSRGSSQPRDWTPVSWFSCIGRRSLYHWATWEAPKNWNRIGINSESLEVFGKKRVC